MNENDKKVMFSKKSDEWSTPNDFYDKLNKEFHFTLDPCATPENAKCKKFYTMDEDGLSKNWKGEVVFINPPYSDCRGWAKKAVREVKNGCEMCVLLLPARCETRAWQDDIFPNSKAICFIRGRLKFGDQKNSAPFPSALCIISGRDIRPGELSILESLGRVLYEKEKKGENI